MMMISMISRTMMTLLMRTIRMMRRMKAPMIVKKKNKKMVRTIRV
jgi:hypothetical protein